MTDKTTHDGPMMSTDCLCGKCGKIADLAMSPIPRRFAICTHCDYVFDTYNTEEELPKRTT